MAAGASRLGAARPAPRLALGTAEEGGAARSVAISGDLVVDLVRAVELDAALRRRAERLGLPPGLRTLDLAAAGRAGWALVEAALERAASGALDAAVAPLDRIALAPPIPRPGKLVCFGRVYAGRSREPGGRVVEEPNIFVKPSTAIIGPGATVRIPRRVAGDVGCGAELALVIARRARHLAAGDEPGAIFGYTIVQDIVARALPKPRARLFDTFAPMGPWIVPADALGEARAVGLRLRVGGRVVQEGSTAEMRFDVPHLLRLLSAEQTLEPGDVVSTGDVGGDPGDFAGQVLEAEVDGIGVLRNPTEIVDA